MILIETHETSFSGSIKRRAEWDMKHKNMLTYDLDFALSNNHLEVIIKSLESKIFNEKVRNFYRFFL